MFLYRPPHPGLLPKGLEFRETQPYSRTVFGTSPSSLFPRPLISFRPLSLTQADIMAEQLVLAFRPPAPELASQSTYLTGICPLLQGLAEPRVAVRDPLSWSLAPPSKGRGQSAQPSLQASPAHTAVPTSGVSGPSSLGEERG